MHRYAQRGFFLPHSLPPQFFLLSFFFFQKGVRGRGLGWAVNKMKKNFNACLTFLTAKPGFAIRAFSGDSMHVKDAAC